MDEINQLKENLKLEIDAITEKIESMQNIGFESQKEMEQLNSQIQVAKERISNNEDNQKRYQTDLQTSKQRKQELEEEKTGRIEKQTNLNSNKEKFQTELNQKEEELKKIMETLSTKQLEIEAKKQQIEQNVEKRYEANVHINTLEANFGNYEKREKAL